MRRIHTLQVENVPLQFTVGEVAEVTGCAEPPKALGPDGVSLLLLKQFDIPGDENLNEVLNLSLITLYSNRILETGAL